MKTISRLYKIANIIDNMGFHVEADSITCLAMNKTSQTAPPGTPVPPTPGGAGQQYGVGDVGGIMSRLALKGMSPYVGEALSRILSSKTALADAVKRYLGEMERTPIQDLYNGSQQGDPTSRDKGLSSFEPTEIGTLNVGHSMTGGTPSMNLYDSLFQKVDNPSQAEALIKSFVGGLMGRLGYTENFGAEGMQGLQRMRFPGAKAGGMGEYVIQPATGG